MTSLLTGKGGFLPELVKKVLERGMAAELTGHLGYERGDAAASEFPNSRNGSTPKVLDTEVGPVDVRFVQTCDRCGGRHGRPCSSGMTAST